MHWQHNPHVLPLVIAATILASIAFFAWRRRSAPGAMPLVYLALAVCEWSLGYALELGSTDLPTQVFWAKVEYLGIVSVPLMWLALTLQYTGREEWLTRRNMALLAIVPLVTLLLVWTNDLHGLVWRSIKQDTSGSFSVLELTYGAGFWVNWVYSYLLLLLGTVLLTQALLRSPPLYRGQAGTLLIGALVPWVGNALYVSGLSPFPNLDLTPFAFTLTGLAAGWGLFRYRLLDIVPVARQAVIEGMGDGMLVLDERNRIVDLNLAAQRIIGRSAAEVIGQPAVQVLSGRLAEVLVQRHSDVMPVLSEVEGEVHEEIILGEGEAQRTYDLRIAPLYDRRRHLIGRLAVLRDITERKRVGEEIRQRTTQLEALRQVSLALTAQLNLDALLNSIVSRAIELVGGSAGGLYLYRPDQNVLEWSVPVGSNLAPIGTVLRWGEGLAGKVWEAGEPLIVDDYRQWEGRAATWEGYPVRAVVSAPIRWGEEFLGVLSVHTDTPHAFSPADAELLSLFAQQAAIAIENARLYEGVQRSLEQLTALRQTSLDITARLHTTTLLEAITRRATELLKAKGGGIYLYDPTRRELTVTVDYGLERSAVGTTLKLGEGMAGRVAQTGEPLIVNDYRTWPGRSKKYAEDQFTAVVEVPLKWQNRVIGVLGIVDEVEERVFTEEDAQLLSLFADQAAIAIENARLYEEARRRAEELRLMFEVTRDVSASLELDEVLERVAAHLCLAAEATSGHIMILDESGERATVRAQYWSPEASSLERTPDVGTVYDLTRHPTILQALRENRPLITHADDPNLEPATRDMMADFDGRSALRIPINVTGVLRGYALIWDSRRRHEWTDEEVRLCQTLANQAAMAIENARLYEEVRQRATELGILYDVATTATTSVHLDEILSRTMSALQETLQADSIAILLVEPGTNELVIRASTGFPGGPTLVRRPIGVGIPGWVVQTGQSVLLADVRQDERYHICDPDTRSELCVPLRVGERVIGALNLESHRLAAFNEEDVRLLSILAGHLAAVIENACLFEETEGLKAFNESIVQSMAEGIAIEDAEGYFTFVNPAAAAMLGYSPEELLGQHWTVVVPPDQQPIVQAADQRRMRGEADRYELQLIRKDGTRIPVLVSGSPRFEGGRFAGTLAVFTDITTRKRLEEQLAHMATHDPLTGVPNRRGFFTLGQQQLKMADRAKSRMLLLFADFDGLKGINDTFGHSEGDQALIEVANVLRETFRESDIIGRIGGDEFAVLALETDEDSAEVVISRLQGNLNARNAQGDRPYELLLSVGLAHYDPQYPCSIDELLARADRAMYERKRDNQTF